MVHFRAARLQVLIKFLNESKSETTVPYHLYRVSVFALGCIVLVAASCIPQASRLNTPATVTKFEGLHADYPTWSPDGKMIAFVDLIAYGDAIGTGYLAVMDMSSRTVTRLNNEEAFYFWPKWSPDSRFLAVSDNYKIWLINVANGEKQYLIEGEGAAWSPNGELLAIFQGPKSGSPQDRVQIVFVNRKGEKLESISMGMINPPKPTPLPAPTEPGVYILPVSPSVFSAPRFAGMDWSPNGQSIAYSIVYPDQKQSNIFRLNMNGTGIEQLTREGMNEQPTWSPDGTKIAYISGTPVPHDLFIATSDGDCRIPLTQGGGYVDRPSWSPDGRQIAIRAYGTIYILDVHAILEDESSYLEKCR